MHKYRMTEYFNTEGLIENIRERPELWNPSHYLYNDKKAKAQTWIAVCESFDPTYSTLPAKPRDELRQKIISKWRNVRDNFTKSIKKRSQNRPYIYARQLNFLLSSQTGTSADDISDIYQDESAMEADEDLAEDEELAVDEEIVPAKEHKEALEMSDDSTLNIENNGEDDTAERVGFVVSKKLEKRILKYLKNRKNTSSIMYFFNSLTPILDTFSEDEQLEFESDVVNVIRKIKYKRTKLMAACSKCKSDKSTPDSV